MGHKINESPKTIRLVSKEFKHSIQYVNEVTEGGNGAATYDLSGDILRRRKAATLAYLETARFRYAEKYPELDIDVEWARLCAAPADSVNMVDEECHISLAAALWFLDVFCECSNSRVIHEYLPEDKGKYLYVEDYTEPRYDEAVIRKTLQLIVERNGGHSQSYGLISGAAARRRCSEVWTASKNLVTDRERFDTLMSMLPSGLVEQISANFEVRMWDYIDRYFACMAEYARKERRARSVVRQISDECNQQYREAGGICLEDLTHRGSSQYPFASPPESQPSVHPVVLSFQREKRLEEIETLAKTGLEKQDEADRLTFDHYDLRLYAYLLPVMEGELIANWGKRYPPEIRQIMEGLTVDDPYETCFAFLCMVEAGSDLPWLYSPALAVLMAAVAKLPWYMAAPGIPGLYEICYGDGEADVNDGSFDLATSWGPYEKRAGLYELQYRPDIMPHPLDPEGPYRAVNLPQLVFGLTGLIMPRHVSISDKAAEALTRAGIPEAEVPVWEKYLHLVEEFQMGRFIIENNLLTGMVEAAAENAEAEDSAALQEMSKRVQELEKQLAQTWDALHTAEKAVKAGQAELAQAKAEASSERQELIDLRELVFYQTSGQEPESEVSQGIQFPYQARQRTVVFGGSDNWLKAIRPLLPGVNFIRRDISPSADLIRRADIVWIQTNYIAHSSYYKVAEIARNSDVPIRYFTCTNAARCAERLAAADQQTDNI